MLSVSLFVTVGTKAQRSTAEQSRGSVGLFLSHPSTPVSQCTCQSAGVGGVRWAVVCLPLNHCSCYNQKSRSLIGPSYTHKSSLWFCSKSQRRRVWSGAARACSLSQHASCTTGGGKPASCWWCMLTVDANVKKILIKFHLLRQTLVTVSESSGSFHLKQP